MCGIIGYLGSKNVEPILIKGLKRLEYRGYDSAGISLMENGEIHTIKKSGKVSSLKRLRTSTIRHRRGFFYFNDSRSSS